LASICKDAGQPARQRNVCHRLSANLPFLAVMKFAADHAILSALLEAERR
jgi:hypothetical protein